MENKICSKCKEIKNLQEFSFLHPAKKDGKLRPDCKACVRKRQSEKILDKAAHKIKMRKVKEKALKQAKDFVKEYLSTHPCVDCGETDIEVLDFDHIKGQKICDVSRMVNGGYRLWRIKDEIDKCEVRCANDHRRITAKRRKNIGD